MFSPAKHTDYNAYFDGEFFIVIDENTTVRFFSRSRKATKEEETKFWKAAEDAGYFYINDKWSKLPKTWEEHQNKSYVNSEFRDSPICLYINIQSQNDKALAALCKLISLRDEYRQGWIPNWKIWNEKYVIIPYDYCIIEDVKYSNRTLLAFQSAEIRDKFLYNFKDLIWEAKDLL